LAGFHWLILVIYEELRFLTTRTVSVTWTN